MIKYVKGDATDPQGDGNKMIIHCCNDAGGWGRGFVLALSKKWDRPEREYRRWAAGEPSVFSNVPADPPFRLGEIQTVGVDPYIFVTNMIGQRDHYDFMVQVDGKTVSLSPVRYGALEECLLRVLVKAKDLDASIHCPRFGAGLAGGDWNKIEDIIQRVLVDNGVEVTVYDLED